MKIYRYIRVAMRYGHAVHAHLSHPDVLAVINLCRYVGGEAHQFKGFTRFSLMENGVYYARIVPNSNVLPILMPHMAERYNDQPFLIHAPNHSLAGVYNLEEWYLVETEHLTLPELAEGEKDWRELWRTFYTAVSIAERRNNKLRIGHMPKRYWSGMPEVLI